MRFQTCPVKSAYEANCRGSSYLNSAEHNYFAVLSSCAVNNRGSTCTVWHSFTDFFGFFVLEICWTKNRISKPEQSSQRKSMFDSWSCRHSARNRRLPSLRFTHGHITSLSSTNTPEEQTPLSQLLLSHHNPGFAQSTTGYCQTQTQLSKADSITRGTVEQQY